MMKQLRQRRQRANQRGFTVVEVVTVVMIMGLIIVPLTTALTQMMKLVPDSSSRTAAATDDIRLLRAFSDDVAQTQLYYNFPAADWYLPITIPGNLNAGSTTPLSCPAAPPVATPVDTNLILLGWADKTLSRAPWTYVVPSWIMHVSTPVAGAPRLKVEIQRNVGSTRDTYLTAYCTPSQANVAQVITIPPSDPTALASGTSARDGEATLKLTGLTDRFGNPISDMTFTGKIRAGFSS